MYIQQNTNKEGGRYKKAYIKYIHYITLKMVTLAQLAYPGFSLSGGQAFPCIG